MAKLRNEIDEMLGPPVQVDDDLIRSCQERNEFGELM